MPTTTVTAKGSDSRKGSYYFGPGMLDEMGREARRQRRSLSQMAQIAWTLARKRIMAMPAPPSDPPT